MNYLWEVKIEYRDDTKETFDCFEFPFVGDKWITLFKDKNLQRTMIPAEIVSKITYEVKGKR